MSTTENTNPKAPAIVTVADLIERFCDVRAVGALAEAVEEDGRRSCQGFCGYEGGEGYGLEIGFEEGYDFLDYMAARGWRPLAAKGEWPYVIYLAPQDPKVIALVEYCEGQLTISEFESAEARREFWERLS